jgi:hypothetical protein
MKINLSKQQYKDLLASVAMANTVHELLDDAIESATIDYAECASRTHELQSYLLEFAGVFGFEEAALLIDGDIFLDDMYFEREIQPVMDDFEEYVLHDNLPNILAWRDFSLDYSDEEQDKMAEENGDFFGVELHPYEERYWKEFETHGFERLFVREDINGENGTPSPYL